MAAGLVEVRAGLRPASVDDRPLLGSPPGRDNVALATGHGADGLLLGPYSALLVARSLLEGRLPEEVAPFSPARFTGG